VIVARDLAQALHQLAERGVRSILLEGGPTLAGAFLSAGLVDRLALFSSPVSLGPNAVQAFARAPEGFERSLEGFPVVGRRRFDEDFLIVRALRAIPRPPAR
jgi:diaminohydroxyphosphoribosylaminopyrimidine deaminase/5-amino-6-(5-phosphoribosylamino)uracil reductase